MSHLVKRLINGALRPFNQEICRLGRPEKMDAFRTQAHLTKKTNPTIFDAGAYIGDVCARYKALFPESTVHVFEPFPDSFRRLKQRFHDDASVKLNECAVSDVDGTVELNANQSSATNSILASDPLGARTWGEGLLETNARLSVPTTTLDAYCHAHAIDAIDILKLDIQGAELKALHGARSMLESGRIGLIYMEMIFVPTYVGQPDFVDYLHYFRQAGYVMLDMFDAARKDFRLIQSDIIFIRPR